jgi:hypothetical protein
MAKSLMLDGYPSPNLQGGSGGRFCNPNDDITVGAKPALENCNSKEGMYNDFGKSEVD